ncbi:hypothetical protein PM082_004528 [Marasmius tenuissimus]|nr:hypothetical protein PM082_004528 [Marasmius tenuissimus]
MPLVRVGYYRIIRTLAPELQLCWANWKADRVAKEGFSSWWQNHGKKILKEVNARKAASEANIKGGTTLVPLTPVSPPATVITPPVTTPAAPVITPPVTPATPAITPPVTPATPVTAPVPTALDSPPIPLTPVSAIPNPSPVSLPPPPPPPSPAVVSPVSTSPNTISAIPLPPSPVSQPTLLPPTISTPPHPSTTPTEVTSVGSGKRPRSESSSHGIDLNPPSISSSGSGLVENSTGSGQDGAPLPKRAKTDKQTERTKLKVTLFPRRQETNLEMPLPRNSNSGDDSMIVDNPATSAPHLEDHATDDIIDHAMDDVNVDELSPTNNNQASTSISTPAASTSLAIPATAASAENPTSSEPAADEPRLPRPNPVISQPNKPLQYGTSGTPANLAKLHYRDIRTDLPPDKIPQGEFWTWLQGIPESLWAKFYYTANPNAKAPKTKAKPKAKAKVKAN